jgi:multisubunit Na+/H+ antiporter MnhC subunit
MMLDSGTLLLIGALGLILIGITGMVLSRHLIRIVFGLALLEAGANLLLILATYRTDSIAPIIIGEAITANMADPVPQALVLTAIVIGVAILALALSLTLKIQQAYGTLDVRELRQRLEKDIADNAGIDLPESQDRPELPAVVVRQGESS